MFSLKHTGLAIAIGCAASTSLSAAEIRVLMGLPLQHVIEEIGPKFEKSSGHKLVITVSGSADTRERFAKNEVFDVVIGAAPEIDRFVKDGKLAAEGIVKLAKSEIGVAVRTGVPKPALTDAGLKDAFLKAKAISYSSGSSGEHLTNVILPKFGIADQVKDKLKLAPSGTSTGKLLANGEADIAIQQLSELSKFPGIDFLGRLPDDLQKTTDYVATTFPKAEHADAGKAFIRMLGSPEADAAIKDAGMTPWH